MAGYLRSFSVLAVLTYTCRLCCAAEPGHELIPGVAQRHWTAAGSAPSFWISHPLAPNAQYEIRVSYPGPEAVLPAIVLTRMRATAAGTGSSLRRRRLLDADKLVVVTNARGFLQRGTDSFEPDPWVGVHVAWRRVAPAAAGIVDSAPFSFDIVLEEAPFGVPRSAVPAVAMACAWVAAVAALLWAGAHHRVLDALSARHAPSPHEA